MHSIRPYLTSLLTTGVLAAAAQTPDPGALEGVIVERYYVADSNDAADEDGSAQLVEGAVTYRIFLDMKAGYTLQYISGEVGHPLTFNTTTTFFNNEDRGETWGDAINDIHLNKNTVAIDSWLCMGAASDAHWGILKEDDPDGSVVGGPDNNDGGSNSEPLGLLSNTDNYPIPLTEADGLLLTTEPPPALTFLGDPFPECFNTTGSSYSSENAGMGVLDTLICPTPGNKILVGQFTTDGIFSFCLNVWLHIPDSLVCQDCPDHLEFFPQVFASDTGETAGALGDHRFGFADLCWSSDQQEVDCLGVPGGSAQPGTSCDDGNADTQNDVFDNSCVCVGEDCLGVLGGNALPGQPCDDNNAGTVNDTWGPGCICAGTVGIEEHPLAVVKIYPNPARDNVMVEITGAQGERITVDVLDALGNLTVRHELGLLSGDRRERFDLSGMSAGAYVLEITIGDSVQHSRLTKL